MGKAEAILPPRERVSGEDYAPGENIRCLLLKIEQANRGPEIILSRSNLNFVRRLFELEVTEIADGTVSIEAMSREAGYRTKIAVSSTEAKVDPVGACVGGRGARVKTIVRELGGEKIDIIRYYSDPLQLLEEALKPAVPQNIKVNEADRRIHFEVSEDDLSVAIGRRGFNAKLTSRLLGWKLDIGKIEKAKSGFDEKVAKAIAGLMVIPGIEPAIAQRLVAIGFVSPEAFEGVGASDLVDAGFQPSEAKSILQQVDLYMQASRLKYLFYYLTTVYLKFLINASMSVRIHQLSKEIGIENKELIQLLVERGFEVKSASSTIDNISADSLREEFAQKTSSSEAKSDAPGASNTVKPQLPSGALVKSAQDVSNERAEKLKAKVPASPAAVINRPAPPVPKVPVLAPKSPAGLLRCPQARLKHRRARPWCHRPHKWRLMKSRFLR